MKPLKIWYHGTNEVTAKSILKEGFKVGTFFAAHLEDALAFGGSHVFEVAMPIPESTGWQVHTADAVPADQIVAYSVYTKTVVMEQPEKRREVFESNSGTPKEDQHAVPTT